MPPQLKTMSPPAKLRRRVSVSRSRLSPCVERPVQRQPARGEDLDDCGEMLVLAPTEDDLVADDDGADAFALGCHTHKTTPPS
jgi:hypothetical protein